MTVKPRSAQGMRSLAQLFGSVPKWTITCGNCSATFKVRIPMVDHPGIPCPTCSAVNVLDIEIE